MIRHQQQQNGNTNQHKIDDLINDNNDQEMKEHLNDNSHTTFGWKSTLIKKNNLDIISYAARIQDNT